MVAAVLATFGCSLAAPSEDEIFGGPKLYRPAAGTYTYDGALHQSFDIPALSAKTPQDFTGFSLASVTHEAAGCWKFRLNASVDTSPPFWEESSLCSDDGNLERARVVQLVKVQSLGSETQTTIDCNPADRQIRAGMQVGDQWSLVCSGSSSTKPDTFDFSYPFQSAGTYTFVGEEESTVGSKKLATYHFSEARQISGTNPAGEGSYTGTTATEIWLSKRDALLVKRTGSVSLSTDTGNKTLGTIDYTETSSWQLLATEPAPLADGGT